VAVNAVRHAAEALRERILDFASEHSGASRDACRLDDDAVRCNGDRISLPDLLAAAQAAGQQLEVVRKAHGAPRSVAFNAQGFRIAVHRVTGEIRILQSVHAADAGTVINPMQCRGQVEGAVAQAVGWALYERMVFDEQGRVVNPTLRNYRIPTFADTPRTEVFFADTRDAIGPLGAKGMGECPVNPVAPALANALADATGVRFRELPFTPDRIYRRIFERHVV
jgi:CO/xanthine dehydrogenase Mo-binding subunit